MITRMRGRAKRLYQALLEALAGLANAERREWRLSKEALQSQLLLAVMAADGRYADSRNLARHHAKVYSQNGMIAEIFNRIGGGDRIFVEVGTGDGSQNNTRFLLEQGWSGYWIDGSEGEMREARSRFATAIEQGRLKLHCGMVTAENIEATLDALGVPPGIDFLSLDIDFNTPHVWRALQRRCRAVCIEYNSSLPASLDLVVPYDPQAMWDGTSWFGGSLKALENIGREKALSLVGCDIFGVNAFFVASQEATGRFREPFTAEAHYEPPRYELARSYGHAPSLPARLWQPARPST